MFLTADGALSANPKSVRGVVQTGGTSSSQPLPNVHVTLLEATPALPTILHYGVLAVARMTDEICRRMSKPRVAALRLNNSAGATPCETV